MKSSAKIGGILLLLGFLASICLPWRAVQPHATAPTPAPSASPPTALLAKPPAAPGEGVNPPPRQALLQLARTAPDLALQQVAALADKHDRMADGSAVCLVVAERHPQLAMLAAWNFELGRFPDDASDAKILETLSARWAEADLAAALEWAATLPADEEKRRDRVVRGMARAAAIDAPALAAQVVMENISPDGGLQNQTVIEIARHLAAHDPDRALAWVTHFPEGPMRHSGIEALARLATP